MSLRNLRFGKLSIEDKGKTINLEIDDEEEDLQEFVEEIEADEEMEEDIQPMRAKAKLPKYVPLRKGRVKVPKDLDAVKSALQTPFLPDGIMFEGLVLGRVPMMKFEDWDLAKRENFPHLETSQLMKQSKEGPITVLKPQKWLCGVEEAGLLHSTPSPSTNHDLCHLAISFPGARWVLVVEGAYSYHDRAYS